MWSRKRLILLMAMLAIGLSGCNKGSKVSLTNKLALTTTSHNLVVMIETECEAVLRPQSKYTGYMPVGNAKEYAEILDKSGNVLGAIVPMTEAGYNNYLDGKDLFLKNIKTGTTKNGFKYTFGYNNFGGGFTYVYDIGIQNQYLWMNVNSLDLKDDFEEALILTGTVLDDGRANENSHKCRLNDAVLNTSSVVVSSGDLESEVQLYVTPDCSNSNKVIFLNQGSLDNNVTLEESNTKGKGALVSTETVGDDGKTTLEIYRGETNGEIVYWSAVYKSDSKTYFLESTHKDWIIHVANNLKITK